MQDASTGMSPMQQVVEEVIQEVQPEDLIVPEVKELQEVIEVKVDSDLASSVNPVKVDLDKDEEMVSL